MELIIIFAVMAIVLAVAWGLVIYNLGIHNERRENFQPRERCRFDEGDSCNASLRNQAIDKGNR